MPSTARRIESGWQRFWSCGSRRLPVRSCSLQTRRAADRSLLSSVRASLAIDIQIVELNDRGKGFFGFDIGQQEIAGNRGHGNNRCAERKDAPSARVLQFA